MAGRAAERRTPRAQAGADDAARQPAAEATLKRAQASSKFRRGKRDRFGVPYTVMNEPCRVPTSADKDKPRRILRRSSERRLGWEDAQAWAREQPWFPSVTAGCRHHPYNTSTCYFWVLRKDS